MWTLIIVFFWAHAPAITQVSGFSSQATCLKAGKVIHEGPEFTLSNDLDIYCVEKN